MSRTEFGYIKYLALEGGGGKGIVYHGMVAALERILEEENYIAETSTPELAKLRGGNTSVPLPIFPIFTTSPQFRPIKGISGASAGAITAFMLAMGMNSVDMARELKRTVSATLGSIRMQSSIFETFFEDPLKGKLRCYIDGRSDYFNTTQVPKVSKMLDKIESWMYNTYIGSIASTINSLPVVPNISRGAESDLIDQFFFAPSYLERKLFLSDLVAKSPQDFKDYEAWAFPNEKKKIASEPYFPNHKYPKLKAYFESLLVDKGLLTGVSVRKYFSDLMIRYLYEPLAKLGKHHFAPRSPITNKIKSPIEISFKDFFNITGVDLVLTGTNITQNIPCYFSRALTPDFPVIEAVGLSMSIPGLFKPYYIGGAVNNSYGFDKYENLKYFGLFVDGGMLNNYPIGAFDNVAMMPVTYCNEEISLPLAQDVYYSTSRNTELVGFSLQANARVTGIASNMSPIELISNKSLQEVESSVKGITPIPFVRHLSNLYDTLMYPAEGGQIRSHSDSQRTIILDTGANSLTDFSSPDLALLRQYASTAVEKVRCMKLAHNTTSHAFGVQSDSSYDYRNY